MSTARDLIKSSLKLLGVLAAGENPSAEEQTDALSTLNLMLDSWSTESLIIFSNTIEDFSFVSSQSVYTMGPTGNFNTARPQKIAHASVVDNSNTPANEIFIELLNFDQWSNIHQKGTTSTFATKLYVDYSNPLVTLNFWPVPLNVNGVRLYSWKPLTEFANVNTAITLPPGYELALRYNLALLLAPEYGRPISPDIAAIATSARENIMRMNIQPLYLEADPAIIARARTFDWRVGE